MLVSQGSELFNKVREDAGIHFHLVSYRQTGCRQGADRVQIGGRVQTDRVQTDSI